MIQGMTTSSYGVLARNVQRGVYLGARWVSIFITPAVVLITIQTLYHRRVRNKNCVVGTQPKIEEKVVKNCACVENDFEWCVHILHLLRYYTNDSDSANSTIIRMRPGNVFLSQALHLYQTIIRAEMAKTIGMSERAIARSLIRAVKMANDQIVVLDISVLASEPTAPSSGGLS